RQFARHLSETRSPASVVIGFQHTCNAARMMMPESDLGGLKKIIARLVKAVPPKAERRPAITSMQLLELGHALMDEIVPKIGEKMTIMDAIQYRDGLMIALTAFLPLRLKNLAALDIAKHIEFRKDVSTILIPS